MPCLRNRIVYKSTFALSTLRLKIISARIRIAHRNDPKRGLLELQLAGIRLVLWTDSIRKALYKNHKYE